MIGAGVYREMMGGIGKCRVGCGVYENFCGWGGINEMFGGSCLQSE